jgi:hypothetical protein
MPCIGALLDASAQAVHQRIPSTLLGRARRNRQRTCSHPPRSPESARFFRVAKRDRAAEPPLPQVDFGTQVVLVMGSGIKSSGGYAFEIVGVLEEDSQILVQVLELSPGPGCGTTAMLTYPTRTILAPKPGKPLDLGRRALATLLTTRSLLA